ncbi:MAG: DUF2264 domain-containing protein [Lachnospiraceae bacterium]|nr:DUF2264 domain-containing protein [Lachnospiraceae bacterium]
MDNEKHVFEPKHVDYELSPYTGLTRESWIEAAEYLLGGIFQNIKDFEDPVVMPRKETKVTYPHSADAVWEIKAEYFEGLARSLFIAAPLIHIKPELVINDIHIRDYYKNQILRSCTPGDNVYVGSYAECRELSKDPNPFRAFQQTVETCALVICLWMSKAEIWDTYTKAERDVIADFLSEYAHGNTVPQNWRLFNMLDLAFLNMEGYAIDADIMREHAQAILAYYAGDGWYRDGHSFDYYSCWAFNVYAPLWNEWYGYEHEPYLAKRFEENSNALMRTYADFFDADGFTNMWGRSNIYRNAATSAFDGNMMLRDSKADPGLARRISSGSLMQFLGREDFLYKGVPTLGFYGQFTPLVQGYSCAESPFWLGKAFLCLHLPADHPFWTAKENNGTWEKLSGKEVKTTTLNGPALCFSNHRANGETILRSGKVVKSRTDVHGMWNYSKLCFNTKYPWESAPCEAVESAPLAFVEAQQYVLHDMTTDTCDRANVTFWHGERDGVLYRRQFFGYELETECHWIQAVNLADYTVPYGVMRADKIRLFRKPVGLTLGAYGFPDNGTEIITREQEYEGGTARAVILKGKDFTGRGRQLAMTIYDGWDSLKTVNSTGTNPDSECSVIVYAETTRCEHNRYEQAVLISQVITKEELSDFADDELFPIQKITYTDPQSRGGYGPVTIKHRDGTVKTIDFDAIEGQLML